MLDWRSCLDYRWLNWSLDTQNLTTILRLNLTQISHRVGSSAHWDRALFRWNFLFLLKVMLPTPNRLGRLFMLSTKILAWLRLCIFQIWLCISDCYSRSWWSAWRFQFKAIYAFSVWTRWSRYATIATAPTEALSNISSFFKRAYTCYTVWNPIYLVLESGTDFIN